MTGEFSVRKIENGYLTNVDGRHYFKGNAEAVVDALKEWMK